MPQARQLLERFVPVLGWLSAGLAVLIAGLGLISVWSYVIYFEEPRTRMSADWRRLAGARALAEGESPATVFNRVYGRTIGVDASDAEIRAWYESAIAADDVLVLDAVIAAYAHERFGGVGAVLPPGLYIAASAIGPDAPALAVLSHYALFPRHGYVLLVRDGEPALEVTASLMDDFFDSPQFTGELLYARLQPYSPRSPGFATPAEPVHDLYLIGAELDEAAVVARLERAVGRLQNARLAYRLFNRNSNSALACMVHASGVATERFERLLDDELFQARLPGITEPLWRHDSQVALDVCTSDEERS